MSLEKKVKYKEPEENDIENLEVGDVTKVPLFTGGKVYTQSVLEEDFGTGNIQIVNVKFAPGARNKFQLRKRPDNLKNVKMTFNQGVAGSRPARPTSFRRPSLPGIF